MIFTHTIYCICVCDFSVVNLVISLTSHQNVMMMWSVWPDHAPSSICRLGGIKGSLHQMMEILRKNPFSTIFTGLSALRDVLEFGAASHQSGYQAGWMRIWPPWCVEVPSFRALMRSMIVLGFFHCWLDDRILIGWFFGKLQKAFDPPPPFVAENYVALFPQSKRLIPFVFQKQTFHLQSCLARKHWICHDVTLPSCASNSPTVAPDTVDWSKPLNTALCDNTRLYNFTNATMHGKHCCRNKGGRFQKCMYLLATRDQTVN